MIAYIDLPLRGQNTVTGHEVLVVGLYAPFVYGGQGSSVTATLKAIYVDEDGTMGEAALSELKINWRFDDRRRKWTDVDTGEELGDDDGDGSDER